MNKFANQPIKPSLDFPLTYSEPSMDDRCGQPWTTKASSIEAEKWRRFVGPRLVRKPIGDKRHYTKRPYPTYASHQSLIDGLVGTKLMDHSSLDGYEPSASDRKDLARWVGIALAFDHNPLLAQKNPRAKNEGTETLYMTLDLILAVCASIAWDDRDMPEWASAHSWFKRKSRSKIDTYRPLKDIFDDLIVLLNAYAQGSGTDHVGDFDNGSAIRGSLAVRLLAGETTDLVPDELVVRLQWLERNMQLDENNLIDTNQEDINELRRMIDATWDRSVLERSGHKPNEQTNTHSAEDLETHPGGPGRKRTL